MSIDQRLRKILMTYACPHCGHRLQKLGDWFYSTHEYICRSRKKAVLLGYSTKIKLFADHPSRNGRTRSPVSQDRRSAVECCSAAAALIFLSAVVCGKQATTA
jgi:hypothetical protein